MCNRVVCKGFQLITWYQRQVPAASSPADLCRASTPDRHGHRGKGLLAIKAHFNNAYHFASWTNDTACCDWYDVDCDPSSGRVTGLRIFQDNFTGTIPAEVAGLPFLTTLLLHKLPNLVGNIPSAITELKHLSLLDLSWNSLSVPVPSFLSQIISPRRHGTGLHARDLPPRARLLSAAPTTPSTSAARHDVPVADPGLHARDLPPRARLLSAAPTTPSTRSPPHSPSPSPPPAPRSSPATTRSPLAGTARPPRSASSSPSAPSRHRRDRRDCRDLSQHPAEQSSPLSPSLPHDAPTLTSSPARQLRPTCLEPCATARSLLFALLSRSCLVRSSASSHLEPRARCESFFGRPIYLEPIVHDRLQKCLP